MDLVWDVRSALEENEAAMLRSIMERPKQKAATSYYIFKHSNWTGNGMEAIKSTYMLMSKKPPKMLGTCLWLVDNKKGTISKEWELPLDVSLDPSTLDVGSPQEVVQASALDMKPAIMLS